MRMSIYCKASTLIGLGHLIRSFSFARQVKSIDNRLTVDFNIVGDVTLIKLTQHEGIQVKAFNNEAEIVADGFTDVLILDMTEIGTKTLDSLLVNSRTSAVLSPIFNHFDKIQFYFGRTKYLNFSPADYPNLSVYASLKYAIIQENCMKISAGTFEDNLASDHFPIAIIMGGGDATNKTLQVLRGLKACTVSATFWVMVGEGYKFSLDELSDEIRKDTPHEIILAKTNTSMWRILKNCVLCIVPGGITSFEAAYAGLPTLNFFEQRSQEFLIKEIADQGGAINFGVYSEETMPRISRLIEDFYRNRKPLLQMHVSTKSLIDNKASARILKTLIESNDWNN